MPPTPRPDRCRWIALAAICIPPLLLATPHQEAAGADAVAAATLPFGPEMGPGPLVVRAGRTVVLVNADAHALHHPYVRADAATLDGGDLPPGATGRIAFPDAGWFTVICAVHPHMRTAVVVR